MGALTINRNKREAEFQPSAPYAFGCNHLHVSKKLKSSNFTESKKLSSLVSRLSLYPKQVTPIDRQIHAPITVVKTFTSNCKQLDTSSRFVPKFPKYTECSGGDRMGNLVSNYDRAKKAAVRTLRHVAFDMEDEVVEVVNVNDKDNDGSCDSGVEEVANVEGEKEDAFNKSGEVQTIRAKYRELDGKSEGKLGFQTPTSSGVGVVLDLVDGRTLENLSLNRRTDAGEGLLYHQKLLSESAKRDQKIRRLDFDIRLYEEKRASFEKLRPVKKEEVICFLCGNYWKVEALGYVWY